MNQKQNIQIYYSILSNDFVAVCPLNMPLRLPPERLVSVRKQSEYKQANLI